MKNKLKLIPRKSINEYVSRRFIENILKMLQLRKVIFWL